MPDNIRYIQHAEPLTPEVANRPLKDIVQRLSQVSNKLDSYTDYANNTLYDQPLEEAVTVGCPVYFNTLTGKFCRARASSHVDNVEFVPDPCAYVLGIVARKSSEGIGNIVVQGVVEIDFEEGGNQDAMADYATLGIRYLSAAQAGRLVAAKPPISIPVAFVLAADTAHGKATVAVSVSLEHILTGHKHYRWQLKSAPAGSCAADSSEITAADTQLEGWLPASAFSGAPTDAVFGYNIAQSEFREYFPAVSSELIHLFWQQHSPDLVPVLGEVPGELYRITNEGIWWLCDTVMPWQMTTAWTAGVPADVAAPVPQDMYLYYTAITYNTDNAVVESLTAAIKSGLLIRNQHTGAPATRGHLAIDLDLADKIASKRYKGTLALKHVGTGYENSRGADEEEGTPVSNGFFFGPVVESFSVNSASLRVASSEQTADGLPTGRIVLDAGDSWDRFPLAVQAIHLDQMRDSYIGSMVGISFFAGQRSGFSGQILVPRADTPQLKIRVRLTFVAGAGGTLSHDMFEGRCLVVPAVDETPMPLPMTIPSLCNPQGDDTELRFNFNVTIPQGQMYFTVTSEPVDVLPGAMFWFSYYKNAGGYTGGLTLIREEGILSIG
ncbi:MAG: hypothetical protein LBU65_17710 [Planctomycetaceae bacterium]|jgi:hypothetical protein|nr:hypothetical protein [Planctomycetaceae bacterium]